MRSLAIAILALLTACGVAPTESNTDATTSVASSLTSSTALLFRGDFSVNAGAALAVGGEARIEYDASRVKQCTGDFNGQPGWSTTAHYTLNNGPEKTLTVAGLYPSGPKPAVIALDHPGTLQIWFDTTSRWGCHEWDSNYGANYRFEVSAPTTIHFTVDGHSSVDGSLKGAKAIAIDYPLARLPHCRQTYAGLPSWEILAYAQFDGAPLASTPATRVENSTSRVASLAVFAVPQGAQAVDLWFLNSDRGGCSEWDSDWGKNFHFEMQ